MRALLSRVVAASLFAVLSTGWPAYGADKVQKCDRGSTGCDAFGEFTDSIITESNSQIGIGTTSPEYKLTISNGTNSFHFNTSALALGSQADGAELSFVGGIPDASSMGGQVRLGGSGRGDGDVNVIQFLQNGTERMRVNNGGNVGIGFADPGSYKLKVNGGGYFAAGVTVYNGGDLVLQSNASDPGDLILEDSTGAEYGRIWSSSDGMDFRANSSRGADLFIQHSSGNVGIGTTDPGSHQLYVNGPSRFRQLVTASQLSVDAGTLTVNASLHSVGIGLGQAGARLQVVGDVYISTSGRGLLWAHGTPQYRMMVNSNGALGVVCLSGAGTCPSDSKLEAALFGVNHIDDNCNCPEGEDCEDLDDMDDDVWAVVEGLGDNYDSRVSTNSSVHARDWTQFNTPSPGWGADAVQQYGTDWADVVFFAGLNRPGFPGGSIC
jgi:hypothetical protein